MRSNIPPEISAALSRGCHRWRCQTGPCFFSGQADPFRSLHSRQEKFQILENSSQPAPQTGSTFTSLGLAAVIPPVLPFQGLALAGRNAALLLPLGTQIFQFLHQALIPCTDTPMSPCLHHRKSPGPAQPNYQLCHLSPSPGSRGWSQGLSYSRLVEGSVLNCAPEAGGAWAALLIKSGKWDGVIRALLNQAAIRALPSSFESTEGALRGRVEFCAGWDHSPEQREAMNTEKKRKVHSLKGIETLQKGPLRCTSHQWPEAIPETKLAFPNDKTRRWQTVTYSQAHTSTKPPESIFFLKKIILLGKLEAHRLENSYILNTDGNY